MAQRAGHGRQTEPAPGGALRLSHRHHLLSSLLSPSGPLSLTALRPPLTVILQGEEEPQRHQELQENIQQIEEAENNIIYRVSLSPHSTNI